MVQSISLGVCPAIVLLSSAICIPSFIAFSLVLVSDSFSFRRLTSILIASPLYISASRASFMDGPASLDQKSDSASTEVYSPFSVSNFIPIGVLV